MDNAGEDLAAGVRAFLVRHYDTQTRLAILEGRNDGSSLLGMAAAEGWFDLAVPETSGGLGMHSSDLVSSFRAFGEKLVVGPFFEHMVLPGLLMANLQLSPAQLVRFARITRGDARLAWVDPLVSLDWQLGVVEVHNAELSGEVAVVRFAKGSDDLLVVAQNPSGQNMLVMVDARASGVTVADMPSADPGVTIARIHLVRAELNVLAQGSDADRILATIRAWARIAVAAELTGIARHTLDLALFYIVERKQFGTPIATFQAVRHLAASATQRVIELECLAEAIASNAIGQDDAKLGLAAMSYKAIAAELARGVVEDSIQMHGGIGFTYEYELQWYYKRALALRAWYGDETELYRAIGRARLAG